MSDNELRSAAMNKAKGAAKDPSGGKVDDKKVDPAGEADKAEGSAQERGSDVQDAAGKFVDATKRR